MSPFLNQLVDFLDRRLTNGAGGGDGHSHGLAGDSGLLLVRALAASILPAAASGQWRRRPSLCHDGTPVLLSVKLSPSRTDAFRLIVEPGSLAMTVAQQIAFSLKALDGLLGRLTWRSAADDLNAIIAAVLPPHAESTVGWWGGIWLGAAVYPVSPPSSATAASSASRATRPPAELRVYLNLRHGDAQSRWRRLARVFSAFPHRDSASAIEEWLERLRHQTSPVGLGVVVAEGVVRAIRVYVAASSIGLAFLRHCRPITPAGTQVLANAYGGFVEEFGLPSPTVTIGYDFIRDGTGAFLPVIGRIKVEVCCQLVEHGRRDRIAGWVERLLADWSLGAEPFHEFTADVQAAWGGSDIQHVSLGFAPHPEHVTVYVKPREHPTS